MSSDSTLLFAFSVHFISNWTISHTNTVKHNIIRFNRIAYNILYVFDREFISNCSNFVYICVRVVVDLNKCRLWYRSRINATIHREIALYFSSVEQTDRFILMWSIRVVACKCERTSSAISNWKPTTTTTNKQTRENEYISIKCGTEQQKIRNNEWLTGKKWSELRMECIEMLE